MESLFILRESAPNLQTLGLITRAFQFFASGWSGDTSS